MRIFVTSFLLLLSIISFSAVVPVANDSFSLDQANSAFDQMTLKLSAPGLESAALESAISGLKKMRKGAEICKMNAKQSLDQIQQKLASITDKTAQKAAVARKDTAYLMAKKTALADQVSGCRLFVIRANEAITAYSDTLHQLKISRLLSRYHAFWRYFVNPGLFFAANEHYAWSDLWGDYIKPLWLIVLGVLLGYVLYWLLIKLILYPYFRQCSRPSEFTDRQLLKQSFYHRLNIIGAAATLLGLLYLGLFKTQAPEPLLNSVHVVGMTIIAGLVLWLVLLSERVIQHRVVAHLCVATLSIVFAAIVVLAWIGYIPLASYLLWNLFLSVFGLVGIVLLVRILNFVTSLLDGQRFAWQSHLRHYLDLKKSAKLPEMVILRGAGLVFILIAYIGFLVTVWGWQTAYPDEFLSGFVHGFHIAHINIEPLQIFMAFLTFIVLGLLGRALTAYIARKRRHDEKDLQVALASIVGYICFIIALVIALLVSGIDFTGLAIVAGALSVGVGLGLQDIVNNFVSGIILLIEKPIRPGDRIIIGQTEGFVRKIRVRSTQIATAAKTDVIVPNAELIKQQVTNYVYHDRNSRIKCEVGVAYGSDTNLVKETLLAIAQANEEVIHDGADQPSVLFRAFADSTLNFELWCTVPDVNRRYGILSDLNFAIEKAFREKEIEIAFPQRDVHLYNHTV